jgi:hypothetical protein
MSLNKTILTVLEEQNVLKTTKTKPIVDAIKNRKKVSFYYSGPRKPKKDSVIPGKRVDAEAVALGLSKKGNLIMRAFIQPPSVSKKGFSKTGWRTFMLSRMSDVQISDETFDSKRPQYKEGDDNSMSVTYVTSDWTKQPEVKKEKKPTEPTPQPVSTEPTTPEKPTTTVTKPDVKPEELPQPKPEEKPSEQPQDNKNQDYEVKQKELYKSKQADWVNKQKEIGGNIKPGQGTRERFKKEVEKELPQPKPQEKPSKTPEEDEEEKNLQESVNKIKRLMFF